jgi:predicted RNA methylase
MARATARLIAYLRNEPRIAPLVRFARRARSALVTLRERNTVWAREKRQIDRDFDARFGVRTGGVTHLAGLRIESERRRFGVDHSASDPEEMQLVLASLNIEHERFTFIDLGSGKGRAVLLASLLPFRRIVGVEFAPSLHQQAVQNVRRFKHAEQRCRQVELVCGDAATFALPEEPLVIYMYNPFGAEVMREVVESVNAALAASPRELLVVYANPFHEKLWTDGGFVEVVRGRTFTLLAPSLPSSLAGPA